MSGKAGCMKFAGEESKYLGVQEGHFCADKEGKASPPTNPAGWGSRQILGNLALGAGSLEPGLPHPRYPRARGCLTPTPCPPGTQDARPGPPLPRACTRCLQGAPRRRALRSPRRGASGHTSQRGGSSPGLLGCPPGPLFSLNRDPLFPLAPQFRDDLFSEAPQTMESSEVSWTWCWGGGAGTR